MVGNRLETFFLQSWSIKVFKNIFLTTTLHPLRKYKLNMIAECLKQRIWPLNDSPCVFPDDVVLCEYKERPVDGKAVLSVGYWVIQSHGPGPLSLGLLHGSRESRRVLCVPAAFHVPISGLHRSERGLVSKSSHSSKEMSRARGLKGFIFQDFH